MQEPKKTGRLAAAVSWLYVTAAVWLLLRVCGHCYPAAQQQVRAVLGGWEGGTLQEAFGTLSEGLKLGLPIHDTVEASVEVLLGGLS